MPVLIDWLSETGTHVDWTPLTSWRRQPRLLEGDGVVSLQDCVVFPAL